MTLIVILISLAIERFIGGLQDIRRFGWFKRYAGWIRSRSGILDGPLGVLLAVGSVAVVVGFIQQKLDWGLAAFFYAIVVLTFSFGPKTFYDRVKEFLGATERGNSESACWYAGEILDRDVTGEDSAVLTRTVAESLFVIVHERILAVIFWFAILGPLGAALYRLVSVLRSQPGTEADNFGMAAARLHYLLAWIPTRLTVLGFAVIGNFTDTLACARRKGELCPVRWPDLNEQLLVCAGVGALGFQRDATTAATSEVSDALALVRRTIATWLAVLALMILSGLAA